jgi:hypothetical protein
MEDLIDIRGVLLKPTGEAYEEDGFIYQDFVEVVVPEPCKRFLPSESFLRGIR